MYLIIDTAGKKSKIALYDEKNLINKIEWEAGRDLSSTIMTTILDLYEKSKRDTSETRGIVVSSGPGSFTGLRIGISTANAFAYVLDIPIVGVHNIEKFAEIAEKGIKKVNKMNKFVEPIIPIYGSEPNITTPKNK